MRQEHRAGEKLFIDFCDPTVPVINPDTRLRELLADMNNRPMKGYGNQTRAERFRVLDAPALSSLPLAPEYKAVKVEPDYHVEYARHWYGQSSTIVVSQFPVDKWHELMESPITADAILDRLVHNAHRLVLQGESMRKNLLVVESEEKTG